MTDDKDKIVIELDKEMNEELERLYPSKKEVKNGTKKDGSGR